MGVRQCSARSAALKKRCDHDGAAIYNVAKFWVKNREAILTQNVATLCIKNRLRFLHENALESIGSSRRLGPATA
jgi:hypothetical protein